MSEEARRDAGRQSAARSPNPSPCATAYTARPGRRPTGDRYSTTSQPVTMALSAPRGRWPVVVR